MTDADTKKAVEILAPKRAFDCAEQAAIACVKEHLWVLWHADDYAAGVIRLLSRAGLLRDRTREAEMAEADRAMRRLADEDNAKRNRQLTAALAEIDRLRAHETTPDAPKGGED